MDLHESGEMYLETILMLKNQNEFVKSIDVAHALNYSKPSVSRAMKLLKDANLIVVDDKGYIDFTEEGINKANKVLERHHTIKEFLMKIGVTSETAESDGCRLEHVISDETHECMKKFLKGL